MNYQHIVLNARKRNRLKYELVLNKHYDTSMKLDLRCNDDILGNEIS